MKHHANPKFHDLADRNYALLKTNPAHGSLRFKIGRKPANKALQPTSRVRQKPKLRKKPRAARG